MRAERQEHPFAQKGSFLPSVACSCMEMEERFLMTAGEKFAILFFKGIIFSA